jgi:cytochrome c oxidase subunit 2
MSFAAVASVLWAILGALAGPPQSPLPQSAPRQVRVEAERFSFTPSRIKVAVGEEIEIRLRSADTDHGFEVEDSDIDVEIPKRGSGEAVVRYRADRPGRYRFECNRMCGAGHHFMRGEIVVEAKE